MHPLAALAAGALPYNSVLCVRDLRGGKVHVEHAIVVQRDQPVAHHHRLAFGAHNHVLVTVTPVTLQYGYVGRVLDDPIA